MVRHKDQPETFVGSRASPREDAFVRLLGFGDDPLTWSIPIGRFGKIKIRIHVILFVWLAIEAVVAVVANQPHRDAMLALVVSIPIIALTREIARGRICRNEGRELETVVIWPLGGLSSTTPRMRTEAGWRAVFAEVGGLICSLVLMPAFALGFILVGGDWLNLEISPVRLDLAARSFMIGSTANEPLALVRMGLWALYHANVLIMLTNLLLPLYPFDAARMLRARQERTLGDWPAAAFTAKVGFLAAIIVLVTGAVTDNGRMMCIAILGGAVTWFELRRAGFIQHAATEVSAPEGSDSGAMSEVSDDDPEEKLDRLLAKVHALGMESLTDDERGFLRDVTERRREV